MQSSHYDKATIAYNSGAYNDALEGYALCLQEDSASFEPGDRGLVYHRLGNCLIKEARYEEAVAAYQESLVDPEYHERGSIHVNLGAAFSSLGRYQEAIDEYHAALDDKKYPTPYRAWMGMGNALSKLGRIVEAGTAYRTAALDEANPNPVKALMNLGASFCALERPGDAVEAYLAILDFKVTGLTLNKTYERLGSAYYLDKQYAKAIQAFTDAQMGTGYQLSPKSLQQFQDARSALAESAQEPSDDYLLSPEDAAIDALLDAAGETDGDDGQSGLKPLDMEISGPLVVGANIPSAEDTGFFTATEAELIAASKRKLKKEKKLRHTGLKVFLTIVIILVVLIAGVIACYFLGIGFPSQKSVINRFFDQHANGASVASTWVQVADQDQATFQRIVNAVAPVDSSKVTVFSLTTSMQTSTAVVSVQLPEGGIIHYQIDLARDFIGWKINGIDLVFASTQAGG